MVAVTLPLAAPWDTVDYAIKDDALTDEAVERWTRRLDPRTAAFGSAGAATSRRTTKWSFAAACWTSCTPTRNIPACANALRSEVDQVVARGVRGRPGGRAVGRIGR